MTIPVTSSIQSSANDQNPRLWELVALGLGLLLMYVPTYGKLSEVIWSQEGQGHGPVMLALVCWLVWLRLPQLVALPAQSKGLMATPLFVFGLLLYAFGRSQEFPEFETGSQLFIFTALLLYFKGVAGVKVMWFPLFFLIFLIPLPNIVVMTVTAPLKAGVSYVSELLMYHAGFPIGRTGVMLTIGQYTLLVADACAGMNSIFALEAIGVFYLSVMKYTNNLRSILLAILILPISFVSNVIRVVVLVLVTYYFGDEAGQGFVHGFAGILLFMVATALTIGLDGVIGWFVPGHVPAPKASQ
jgi:exosortase B